MPLGIKATRAALEAGDTVYVTHPDCRDERQRNSHYALTRAGKSVTERAFQRLKPEMEPVGDGLFGDSQTWRLRA